LLEFTGASLAVGPIFARELLVSPRRPRYFVLRAAYLTLFFVLVWTAWQAVYGFETINRAGDFPYFSVLIFPLLARVQLVLVLFISALFGASSISHEKDRRTLLLLIMTRLEDRTIIVEKFLGGLLHVVGLMFAALPVFMLLLLMGGLSGPQVFGALAATLGAALLANAIGVVVAAWREKTFQAVALTLMAVILWMLAVEIAAAFVDPEARFLGHPAQEWWSFLSPFRAMNDLAMGSAAGGFGFLIIAALATALLLAFASWRLRSWYPANEPITAREPEEHELKAEAAVRPPQRYREVTGNPVLWREIKTRAYGRRPILVKLGYILICGIVLWGAWSNTFGRPAPRTVVNEDGEEIVVEEATGRRSPTHFMLTTLVAASAILGLMLLNTQAVTAITSERDIKALDLLLATRITPAEFIFGKLVGILYNAKEMVLIPLGILIAAVATGLIEPSSFVYSVVVFLVFTAFATILGVHAALRYDSTKAAIGHSLGTMFLLFVGILICLFLILVSGQGRFGAQWASFLLFIVLGSIGLWVSLSADAPSNAIGLTAAILPFATFYCVVAFLVADRTGPLFAFLVATTVYSFAVAALLVPLLTEFDVATGRTTHAEGD
jgi:ABC-type transport system involved in multi-copper enzyme maturation permease subunit